MRRCGGFEEDGGGTQKNLTGPAWAALGESVCRVTQPPIHGDVAFSGPGVVINVIGAAAAGRRPAACSRFGTPPVELPPQQALALDETDDLVESGTIFHVG